MTLAYKDFLALWKDADLDTRSPKRCLVARSLALAVVIR
jgi:hypothetical protein